MIYCRDQSLIGFCSVYTNYLSRPVRDVHETGLFANDTPSCSKFKRQQLAYNYTSVSPLLCPQRRKIKSFIWCQCGCHLSQEFNMNVGDTTRVGARAEGRGRRGSRRGPKQTSPAIRHASGLQSHTIVA
ncbi:hypothetical protein EVAR_78347_1 [Eumeta japonica]|uniref:Uncharacterized protein n=1 Tax=Eumeta variegata TaxID=151549 RepID=A0A4C1T6U7_EUMVA|nr:hypothetical protein EVAR_78347_1 [Eumeta japonica]